MKALLKRLTVYSALLAIAGLTACATVKPVDERIVVDLAGLKTQVASLYGQFSQEALPAQAIDDVRSKLTIIKSRSDAREGKDSHFSTIIATIQETFEKHVVSRQKGPWSTADIEDYGQSIGNMIQDALDVENKRAPR